MASCVAQTQGAHRLRLGPSRRSADGGMGCPCATEGFSHYKGYLGHRPLARRREQARCETNLVWVYPADKENEMKRIDALRGMRWLVIVLVFQVGYTATGAAQEVQAESVDSLAVEAEHQAVTQQKTEPKEITIYIRGEHKAVAAALLEAVDEGTLVTGIADFDALSATYGLTGIHRTGRISPFYYGNRFRLTFPLGADVAAIAGAYWNLSYIQSIEPEPPPGARARKTVQSAQADSMDSLVVKKQGSSFLRVSLRLGKKVASGTIVGIVFSPLGSRVLGSGSVEGDSGLGRAVGAYVAFGLGYPIGVYLVDARESSFWLTLIGGGLGWWGAASLLDSRNPSERAAWVTFFGAPVLASELSRMDAVTGGPKRPKESQDLWFSFGLIPQPHRGLSAVATLRF